MDRDVEQIDVGVGRSWFLMGQVDPGHAVGELVPELVRPDLVQMLIVLGDEGHVFAELVVVGIVADVATRHIVGRLGSGAGIGIVGLSGPWELGTVRVDLCIGQVGRARPPRGSLLMVQVLLLLVLLLVGRVLGPIGVIAAVLAPVIWWDNCTWATGAAGTGHGSA